MTVQSPFRLRAVLGEHLSGRLVQLGVAMDVAVQAAIHFATQDGLLDAIAGGHSIVVFYRGGFAPELFDRDGARGAAADLRAELCLEADEVHGVDIGPVLHYLRGGAELN